MQVNVIVENAKPEILTLDKYELDHLKDDLNNPDIQFLLFKGTGHKIMINKNRVIKVWWNS